MSGDMRFAIDVFTLFAGRVCLRGWLFDPRPILSLALRGAGLEQGEQRLHSYGTLPSLDVASAIGAGASSVRFDESFAVSPEFSVSDCVLAVSYRDGGETLLSNLGLPANQRAPQLITDFCSRLAKRTAGSLLEIGSRARSGVTRRNIAPPDWRYVGFDIIAGPNVDRVGDAHELSSALPGERFDAVMAFSVLEHLLMPWKVVIELNAVLNEGALGLFTTHQCWPIHDAPWDFWRFSDRAWDALFNKATGFEIIETSMGEPAFVVAQRCHAATDFGMQPAWLASNVLFRKTGPTRLRWDVTVGDIINSSYPAGEIPAPGS